MQLLAAHASGAVSSDLPFYPGYPACGSSKSLALERLISFQPLKPFAQPLQPFAQPGWRVD